MRRSRWWAMVLMAGLTGCQTQQVLNALTPRGAVEVATNIVYDPKRSLKLDVYTPEGAIGAPVVVFFHGGRWQRGSKDLYAFVGEALASRGIVAVIPNLRRFPQAAWPAFMEDAAAAVGWARGNVRHYGGDPAAVFVMGHSSGAHIAALLALDRRWLGDAPPAGMIGLAGPYDFLPLRDADLIQIFAAARPPEVAQPIHHARGDAPPLLLIHGADDRTVAVGNSRRLAEAVRRAGGAVTLVEYEKMGHARLIAALSAPLRPFSGVLDEIAAFVDRHAAAAKAAQTQGARQ